MNSKEKFENILCETIDLGSFFFLVFEKKNTKVFLMDSVDFYDNHTLDKTIYERILGLIRKDMSIVRVPQLISNNKSTNDIWWDANKKSLEYFDSDIYNEQIDVRLIKYMREESSFDNLDTLKIQLEQDKANIKAVLMSDNLDIF